MAGKFFDNPYHVIYNYLVQFIDSHRVVPRNIFDNISWYYFLLYINYFRDFSLSNLKIESFFFSYLIYVKIIYYKVIF